MSIVIPGYGDSEGVLFFPQIFSCNREAESLLITGSIDQEIEQSVYLSVSICLEKKVTIPNYLHIHFPDYCYMKCGISASLGVFLNLYFYLQKKTLKKKYMATGEIDLDGSIYPVGLLKEKTELFRNSDIDYFFVPYQEEATEEDNLFKVKTITEVITKIEQLEKI